MSEKNLRLLGVEQPPNWQPDIFEMISSLKCEISKGEVVYSRAELQKLEQKLADYEINLERLSSH